MSSESRVLGYGTHRPISRLVFSLDVIRSGPGAQLRFIQGGRYEATGVQLLLGKWTFVGFIYHLSTAKFHFYEENRMVAAKAAYFPPELLLSDGLDMIIGGVRNTSREQHYNFHIACVQIFNVTMNARQVLALSDSCRTLPAGEEERG